MILDQLILQNFGVYAGLQSVLLTSEPAKPIVLIGGLNGRGKTTFLDAIQLVLYGKAANCSSRGSSSYDDFLSNCRHRGIEPDDVTFVELSFSHSSAGKVKRYRLRRSWGCGKSPTKDLVQVWLDETEDAHLADSWADHVEGLIPNGVSHLFFFDGEKIEQLADPKSAPRILSTGINSLLGLDILDRLSADLTSLERKNSSRSTDDTSLGILKSQKDLDDIAALHAAAAQDLAQTQLRYDFLQKDVTRIETEYQSKGGILADDRSRLIDEQKRLKSLLEELNKRLRETAAGDASLLLIEPLLHRVATQSQIELKAEEEKLLQTILEQRDNKIVTLFRKVKLQRLVVSTIEQHLKEDRLRRQKNAKANTYLEIGRGGHAELTTIIHNFAKTRTGLKNLLLEIRGVNDALQLVDRKLASIPSNDSFQDIASKLIKTRAELGTVEGILEQKGAKYKSLAGELDRQTSVVRNLRERALRSEWATRDSNRILVHSNKVKVTLDRFKQRVLIKHVERIQSLVLESLSALLGKERLVNRVDINPVTLELSLFTLDGTHLLAERLSAGERQLLAIALLWGLAKASGRTLPTIIDTPMGRLDSVHRSKLIESYFPQASHQVILLSTDEEINGAYYDALLPSICRSYLIQYDDTNQSSVINKTYFPKAQ
jgi:DNA sulfur modification protein DndD